MKLIYPALIIPKAPDDFTVQIPDMNLATRGSGFEDALDSARECMCMTAIDMRNEGSMLPPPDFSIAANKSRTAILTLIDADLTAYEQSVSDENSVTKNVIIPSWLGEAAEAQNIDLSALLKEALIEKLHIKDK